VLSVAHYHPCLTGSGGDRVSEAELRYLSSKGHRVSFLVAYDPCGYEPAFASLGAQWAAFRGHDVTVREARATAREVMPEAVRFLENQRADLLHCHNVSILPQALMLTRAVGIPLFATIHTRDEKWSKWRWSYKAKRRAQFRMIREALEESAGLFAVSRPAADHVRRLFGPAARHIEYLPNPIHDVFFDAPPAVARDYDVAVLGRPVAMKNPKLIGEAFAGLCSRRPAARMVWIGATGEEPAVRKAIRDRTLLRSIEFVGQQSPEEVRSLLYRSKALLLASLREGFGLAAAEAALCGCRLALSDIPALRAHFDIPGVWFFPVRDSRRALCALESALKEDAPVPDASTLGLMDERAHGERLLRAYEAGLKR
jgi:glycosyltransferase involved in cell wall biosynthesis